MHINIKGNRRDIVMKKLLIISTAIFIAFTVTACKKQPVPVSTGAEISTQYLLDEGYKAYQAKDYDSAHALWKTASDKHDPISQYYLGLLYARGEGVNKDDVKALEYYTLSAEGGYADAQLMVSNSYSTGKIVTQDFTASYRWCLKAAKNNLPQAQYLVGRMYMDGRGTSTNVPEGTEWLTRAAKNGIPDAQYYLGYLYYKGRSIPQDFEKAYAWFNIAGENGNKNAITAITSLATEMTEDQIVNAIHLANQYKTEYTVNKQEK